ncbi:MAG: 30S ribosomal protein S12 methylthiotransferase RimO [Bacteroidota bacterium]
MAKKNRISVVSMGCPKNVVDSEKLLAQLKGNAFEITDDIDRADTVVINTCGFIQDAKQESLDAIVEAIEKKKQGKLKKIVVMGCLAERYKQELVRELPEVDAFFGTSRMESVLTELGAHLKKELLGERFLTTPSHFAYLKISEGCDNPCSFCAIPLMRGRHRSVPVKHLVQDAERLAGRGVKELIVIAQDSTSYGLDLYEKRSLSKLLVELHAIDGIEWIRLMYAYPAKFPLDLIETYRQYPKLCRSIDMPVQHIADSVLKSMRRGISGQATKKILLKLKKEIPELALRTTFIVGYPNETDDDFRELLDFTEEMQFHRLGVFPYSMEEGTGAYALGDPVPRSVKEERAARIMELQREISRKQNEALIGRKIRVLIDRQEEEYFIGRTQWDAPEIDQEVIIHTGKKPAVGTFETVAVNGAADYDLEAVL